MPNEFKLAIGVVFLVLAFGAGWKANSWKNDSEQLAVDKSKAEFTKMYQDSEQKQATTLQNKLDELHANEKVVNHEITKIITHDVYHNECIDDAGLRFIESARAGKANPSEPTQQVSGTN